MGTQVKGGGATCEECAHVVVGGGSTVEGLQPVEDGCVGDIVKCTLYVECQDGAGLGFTQVVDNKLFKL